MPDEVPDDTTVGGLLGWIGEDVARYLARRVAAFLAFASAVIGLVGETPQVTSVAAVVVGAVGLVAVVGSAVTGLGRTRQWWVIGAVAATSLALVAVATAQRVSGP